MNWVNPKITKYLHTTSEFWQFFWHSFFSANCIQSSAALAYTTLLSLVPLMVVSFAVFTAFPVFESASSEIQDFVFNNFVPSSGEIVQEHLQSFSSKARQLTGTGIIFLMITSVMMMSTIEKALNSIWQINQRRNFLSKFIVYWAVLTLGPLLIGIGMAITSYVVSIPLFAEPAVLLSKKLGLLKTIPFFMEAMAFTLLYLLVPVTQVRFSHAVAGGLVAALLFELAKFGFTLYITHFPTYQTIYGALASIPIFLVWVYFSWIIALLGAQFTYSLAAYRFRDHQQDQLDSSNNLVTVLRILRQFWEAQASGQVVTLDQLAESLPEYDEYTIQAILESLKDSNVVTQDAIGNWLLLRNLSQYKLGDLYRQHPFSIRLENFENPTEVSINEPITKVVRQIDRTLNQSMDLPISQLFADKAVIENNFVQRLDTG